MVVVAGVKQLDEGVVGHIFLVVVEAVPLLPDVVACVLLILFVERFLDYWWSLRVWVEILHVWKAHVTSHLRPIFMLQKTLIHVVLGE